MSGRSAATFVLLLSLAGSGWAADPVLSAIEELESRSDAKCNSSANRFEDFLFGTPLSEPARTAHVELQKRLVHRIWVDASARAAAAGLDEVGATAVTGALERRLAVERGDGQLRAEFPGGTAVVVPEMRAEQYGTIAYSLRAILGVQQDFLVSGGAPLLELDASGVESLRQALDVFALSALELADREARRRSEFSVDAPGLRAAWQRLAPELAEPPPFAPRGREPPSAAEARARSLALLDELVEGKTSAYRAYNELDDDTTPLLVFNISRFYARRPLSRQRPERRNFVERFGSRLDGFSHELLRASGQLAREAGQRLIRAQEAGQALQALTPHTIDELEDVHFFGRLPAERRVSVEIFDCDSFRDFGLHWGSLQRAAHAAPEDLPLPDPFAAEVLAEGISNYGVLLLRVGGEVAERSGRARLEAADLGAAEAEIRDRALRHHAAPVPVGLDEAIVSARRAPSSDGSGPYFTDATGEAGVAFTHRSSRWLGEFRHKQLKTPPTFSGGGVAAEDVDGDGDTDLLFVGGGGNALLLNDGSGHFRDITREAGVEHRRPDGSHGEARQPLVADFDNDGHQDILITYVDDDHRLYRGLGGARFEDVSAGAGLGGRGLVGGPATAFDFDGDGLLDVYIGYFGDYLHGGIPTFDRDNQNALPNRLFRNLGGLRFGDVTEGSGSDDTGWTQAVSHMDFDRDGRQDLVVANDYGRNAFLRNLGGGRFENVAAALGVTKAFHSMNVGIADLNDDDHPDIYISNLATLVKDNKYSFPDVNTPLDFDLRAMAGMLVKESDILYMSHLEAGRLAAYLPSNDVERGETSTGWAWDAEFFDFDHDGDDDLYLVNGTNDFNTFSMIYRRVGEDGARAEYLLDHRRESNVFFVNEGGVLRNRSSQSGADLAANSRSTAYLDLEGDGDLDVAVNHFHARATVLRNDADKQGRGWLALRLVGDPGRRTNRDAIGARILVTTDDGRRLRREVQGGSGFLSMNPKQQHLGLGHARSVDVEIAWPNGETQVLRELAPNAAYRVLQGVGVVVGDSEPRTSCSRSCGSSMAVAHSRARPGEAGWRASSSRTAGSSARLGVAERSQASASPGDWSSHTPKAPTTAPSRPAPVGRSATQVMAASGSRSAQLRLSERMASTL